VSAARRGYSQEQGEICKTGCDQELNGPGHEQSSAAPTRRRQARGQRRIDQILETAAQLFTEIAFEATTTIAIAARAGTSPGSLSRVSRTGTLSPRRWRTVSWNACARCRPSSVPRSSICRLTSSGPVRSSARRAFAETQRRWVPQISRALVPDARAA
jgi:hypothetical protein